MTPSNEELKALFVEQSAAVIPSDDFDERLDERLHSRRQRRFFAVIACVCLFVAVGVGQWQSGSHSPPAEDTRWFASLDAIWLEYDAEKDALLEEGDWSPEDAEFPSEYEAIAQVFDETDTTEVIQ